jgi:hypothetical protein
MIPLPIIETDSLKTAWAQLPEEAKPETREGEEALIEYLHLDNQEPDQESNHE